MRQFENFDKNGHIWKKIKFKVEISFKRGSRDILTSLAKHRP